MSKKLSVEMLNVHPTMASALRQVKLHPTPFQVRVLSSIKTDFADVVVDGRAAVGDNQGTANSNNTSNGSAGGGGSGVFNSRAALTERHTLITIFLGHSLLYTDDPPRCTAVLLANTKDTAAQLKRNMKFIAQLCDIECHVLTQEGGRPSLLLPQGGDAAGVYGDSQLSACTGRTRQLIITTLRVMRSWDKELLKSITTFAVEDAGHHNERHLEEILRWITSAAPLPASGSLPSHQQLQGGGNNYISSLNQQNTSRSTANIFLMYLWPLTKVSPRIRYCLNRRNRRYYPLQSSSPSSGVTLQTPSGTAPPSSTQLVHLLYLDEKDREEQLHRVLQIHRSHRVVILTHHKEIKQLYQTVSKWGLYNTPGDSLAGGGGKGTKFMCSMFRTDGRERRDATLMGFLGDLSTNSSFSTGSNNDDGSNSNSTNIRVFSSLLVTWDANTEIDLMDVDVFIQYYPPQKSLTERERREYVQVLHTTADPESNGCGRRTTLITFLSTNDFTLASFFMGQYGQSGPILNISPQHPLFERCLRDPKKVLKLKLEKEEERREREKVTNTSSNSVTTAATGGGGDGCGSNQQHQQQQKESANTNSGPSGGGGGGGVAAPLPVPRSRINVSSTNEKKKDQVRSRSNKKGGDKHNRNTPRGRGGVDDRLHEVKKSAETATTTATATTTSRRTTGMHGSNGNSSKRAVYTSSPPQSTTATATTRGDGGRVGGEGTRGSHRSR